MTFVLHNIPHDILLGRASVGKRERHDRVRLKHFQLSDDVNFHLRPTTHAQVSRPGVVPGDPEISEFRAGHKVWDVCGFNGATFADEDLIA